jgi:hypothetical protein
MTRQNRSDDTSQSESAFERFEEATRRLLSIPKREVEKAELRRKKEQGARKVDHESGPPS